jgi:hypothetical protein
MKASSANERSGRRSFLKGTVLAGSAALFALGPVKGLTGARQPSTRGGSLTSRHARYRETEHIRTYYHLARL